MLKTGLIIATAVGVAVASPALAVEESDFLLETAGNLAALCAANSNPPAIHMCQGYLVGVNHMHAAVGEAFEARVYCLPGDGSVSRDSAARDFAAWVNATPSAAAMPAREGLLEWARNTYPCK